MFEKCCICKAGAGIWGTKKSGFVRAGSSGLRKQENRAYLNDPVLWLCPDCLQREKACDMEAIKKEERLIQKQKEEELREQKRREEEWRQKVDQFKCPEIEPYITVWSWLYNNIGRTVKVEAVIYDGDYTSLPIITDKWRISVPQELEPPTWTWQGEYQWVSDSSGKKSKKYCNWKSIKLVLDISKPNRGFQTAEVSGNTLTYEISYARYVIRDSFDEAISYLRDPKDPGEISGHSSYSFTLTD